MSLNNGKIFPSKNMQTKEKTQFSFYQDHQFHKIEDLPCTTMQNPNVFNWLHHNEKFNFLYYPFAEAVNLSSFVFFFRSITKNSNSLFFCWILCDMRWNELVPLYIIRRSSTTEKKILTQKLCRLNCTRYHFHLHQKTFLSCTRYGRSNM